MTGRQDLYDESMQLGHSAAWDLKWDRAIGYYRKALAEFPEDPRALTSLGLALLLFAVTGCDRACTTRPSVGSPTSTRRWPA